MSAAPALPDIDEKALQVALDRDGFAILPRLLDDAGREAAAALYDDESTPFRSTVVMVRQGYGRGEYRYFRAAVAGRCPEPPGNALPTPGA